MAGTLPVAAGDWPELSPLLDELLDLAPAERAAWLAALPAAAQCHRSTLERLLTDHAAVETGDFMSRPSHAVPAPPRQAGPWRLLRELGRGGMGSVWLAEAAAGPLQRPIAVKLPHPGLATRTFAERLARERDILAALDHPHIARLHDAGFDAAGQPYVALEYVDGRPLGEHCEAAALGLDARLALFDQVLAAVQYAHANLVLHRDLKPSNVLVDRQGRAKLLDFGIAKLMVGGQAEATELTLDAGRPVSPDYAAPEQLTGAAVTTASDVYSLGVLLYELLTGQRPYHLQGRAAATLIEALKAADPVRPSVAAAMRQPYARRLRGDLDAIVAQAMKIDPAARYATVLALREDLQRQAAGEPVRARPDGALYRTGKFMRRHRAGVAAAAALVLALAGGGVATLWQAQRATLEAQKARAVQDFMLDIFRANTSGQADPVRARETTARQLLDLGAQKVGNALRDSPQAKSEVLQTLAELYSDLRLNDKAADLQGERVALLRRQLGPDDPRLARALLELAIDIAMTSRIGERDRLLAEAEAILDRAHDHGSDERAMLLTSQAEALYDHDPKAALAKAREAVEIRRRLPVDDGYESALTALASMYGFAGRPAEAEAAWREALALSQRLHPDGGDMERPQIYQALADARVDLRDYAGAEAAYRDGARAARRLGGDDALDAMRLDQSLGIFLFDIGRSAEALALMDAARKHVLATRGLDDPLITPWILTSNGNALVRYGRVEEGLALITQAEANQRRFHPGGEPLAKMLEREASGLADLGRGAEAERKMAEALEIRHRNGGGWGLDAAGIGRQVNLLLAAGRVAEAKTAFAAWPADSATPETGVELWWERAYAEAELASAAGDDEGLRAFTALQTRLDADPKRDFQPHKLMRSLWGLGEAQARRGDCAAALAPLTRAAALVEHTLDPATSLLGAAIHGRLADCRARLGQRTEARAELARAEAALGHHQGAAAAYAAPAASARRRLGTA